MNEILFLFLVGLGHLIFFLIFLLIVPIIIWFRKERLKLNKIKIVKKKHGWTEKIFSTWFFFSVGYGTLKSEIWKFKISWLWEFSSDKGVEVIRILVPENTELLIQWEFMIIATILLGWWFYISWNGFKFPYEKK